MYILRGDNIGRSEENYFLFWFSGAQVTALQVRLKFLVIFGEWCGLLRISRLLTSISIARTRECSSLRYEQVVTNPEVSVVTNGYIQQVS